MDHATDGALKPILVTGATGFTGGRLAHRLCQDGHTVRALVRSGADVAALKAFGVELVEGDLVNPADVSRAAEGAGLIYHIAAVYRTAGHPDRYYHDVNVRGTENVLEAAHKHGVARTVHCSTIGVHGDVKEVPCREDSPFNPGDIYQETKLEAELKASEAFRNGIAGCVFRPAGIYGPGDMRFLKLFKTLHNGTFRMFGSGKTLFHPIYIDDLIDGILLCGTHPAALGKTFILAGERYESLDAFVTHIAQAMGRPPPSLHLPFWPLKMAAVACETLCRPFGIDPPLHRRRVAFFVKGRSFSIDKAKREIGFRPGIDIDEGVRRTARWYFENGYLS